MQTVERVIINASPSAIWQVLADVERWPTWTPTVLEVEPLTSNGAKNGLKVGARYRVVQPKLRPAVYEVTECAPHQAFTWIQKAPGATLIAEHRLTASDHSGTEVELSFATQGLFGALLGGMYSKTIADYVRTEARSLKQHCESLATEKSA
jgi:uncharacterized protein YndB with AHSA1/START domain